MGNSLSDSVDLLIPFSCNYYKELRIAFSTGVCRDVAAFGVCFNEFCTEVKLPSGVSSVEFYPGLIARIR
jgi:hypothetical protein